MQDLLKNVAFTVKARFVFKVIYKVETFIYVLLIQIMFQKKYVIYCKCFRNASFYSISKVQIKTIAYYYSDVM